MNMRYVTAWVAALVCAGLGSASILAAFAPHAPVRVEVTLDWEVNQRPIAGAFAGVSVSAADEGNGVSAAGVATSAVSSMAQLRVKMVRFPDDISQSYHFMDAPSAGQMTTFEMWSLVSRATVPNIMITVNMASARANEARDWVAYSNLPASTVEGGLRAAHGSSEPFNIQYWLMGEDIRSYGDAFETPEAYADAALANATRMKAVSPTIQVGLWMDDGATPEGVNWNQALFARVSALDPGQASPPGARLIDFVAVAVTVEAPNRPLTDSALYPTLYAQAEARADAVVTAAETAVQSRLRVPLPVAVYRYGLEFGAEGWNQDKADSAGAAIALAGMVNAFLRHDQLFTTVYKGLNAHSFAALLQVPTVFHVPQGQRFAPNAFAEVLGAYGLFAAGNSLTVAYTGQGSPSEVARAHYQAPPLGRLPERQSVPLVSAAAALDLANDQMVVFLASRSLTDQVVVTLRVLPTAPSTLAPSVFCQGFAADALSMDTYSGASRLDPTATQRDLLVEQTASAYTYSVTLERNAFMACSFRVA